MNKKLPLSNIGEGLAIAPTRLADYAAVPIARRTALSALSGLSTLAFTIGAGSAGPEVAPYRAITIRTDTGRRLSGLLSLPERLPAPAILSIHGSLGLTHWYRAQAAELSKEGFVTLAVDLFPGQTAGDLDGEQRLISAASRDAAGTMDTLVGWVDWLRRDSRMTRKVGIVGWSFGAWWALRASIAAAPEATVIYYGLKYGNSTAREKETVDLARLKGPLLAHFGSFDSSIPKAQVDRFRGVMDAAGKSIEIDWYPAGHGFADPTRDFYDQPSATAAWKRTVDFLRAHLASPPAPAGRPVHVER